MNISEPMGQIAGVCEKRLNERNYNNLMLRDIIRQNAIKRLRKLKLWQISRGE